MWRYGYKAPLRKRALVRSMTDAIAMLYAPDIPPFETSGSVMERLSWTSLISRTTADILDAEGINPQ